jgi:hypothetical protein
MRVILGVVAGVLYRKVSQIALMDDADRLFTHEEMLSFSPWATSGISSESEAITDVQ